MPSRPQFRLGAWICRLPCNTFVSGLAVPLYRAHADYRRFWLTDHPLSVIRPATSGTKQSAGRFATSMCLFLLAMSFVHFGTGHAREAWSGEIVLHHAGIPLSMIILLQDYRVLLIDAFLRLLADGALALGTRYALVALYNFLSTFSGTHFVMPRAYQAAIGFVF